MAIESTQYKKIILSVITQYLPHAKVILYGSRARGDEGQGSDIDIALDVGKKVDSMVLSKIIEALEESPLPIFFDIVDFFAVPRQLQDEIVRDGIIWKE